MSVTLFSALKKQGVADVAHILHQWVQAHVVAPEVEVVPLDEAGEVGEGDEPRCRRPDRRGGVAARTLCP